MHSVGGLKASTEKGGVSRERRLHRGGDIWTGFLSIGRSLWSQEGGITSILQGRKSLVFTGFRGWQVIPASWERVSGENAVWTISASPRSLDLPLWPQGAWEVCRQKSHSYLGKCLFCCMLVQRWCGRFACGSLVSLCQHLSLLWELSLAGWGMKGLSWQLLRKPRPCSALLPTPVPGDAECKAWN